ncbi:MAG TPA: DUF2243 domain-containing protein [Blastocatellia bacterium]|nr:DUF2243 domain-containing protein [Blastocatellia bacterium]
MKPNRAPLVSAGTLLGIGLGGFVDGIVFHQILQLHNMLTARLPRTTLVNAEINMFWDGLFHAFTWIMTVLGLALLWRAFKRDELLRSTPVFIGSMVLGWGLFNLVEGLIDHQLLGIHHVVEVGNQFLWDMLFLASGVVFIGVGWLLIQRTETDTRQKPAQ